MPAQLVTDIVSRVNSILTASPFSFVEAHSPFSFDLDASPAIDKGYRIETRSGRVTGGLAFTETRIDLLDIWLARALKADPQETARLLRMDASSITAAVTRDGLEDGGDYDVPDEGRAYSIAAQPGQAFAVLRLTLPVDYDAQL